MNPKVNQVQLHPTLHLEAVLAFAFLFSSNHPAYVNHPRKCPFNFLYALKPKNPV